MLLCIFYYTTFVRNAQTSRVAGNTNAQDANDDAKVWVLVVVALHRNCVDGMTFVPLPPSPSQIIEFADFLAKLDIFPEMVIQFIRQIGQDVIL